MTDTSSIQAEYYVLGALISKPSLGLDIDLQPEHFSQDDTSQVFAAILQLHAAADPIDMLTVSAHLERITGRQWLAYIGDILRSSNAVASNVRAYAVMIREAWRKREALKIAQQLIENIESEESIDEATKNLLTLNVARRSYEFSGTQAASMALQWADDATHGITGLATNLSALDHCLGGLHGGDLIIIGANTGVGKTATMVNLALLANSASGIISSEQGYGQIGQRLIGIKAQIAVHSMRTGRLTKHEWDSLSIAASDEKMGRIWINDKPAVTLADIQRQARKWKFERGIKCLYVDYLQRLKAANPKQDRRIQIGELARGLKELARELDLPVVALAQLNRDAKKAGRPEIEHLAEGAEIEREADQVLLLYREESQPHIMQVMVGKNRHGPMGKIDLAWEPSFMRLGNLENHYQWP